MALCLSIFLEAISRFVEPQKVSNPKLVLWVGIAGLVSNLVGLFLFHEHGHSHGDRQEKSPLRADEASAAERGTSQVDVRTQVMADDGGNLVDVLPQSNIGGWRKSARKIKSANKNSAGGGEDQSRLTGGDGDDSIAANSQSPVSARKGVSSGSLRHHRQSNGSRRSFANPDDFNVHPASFRSDFIAASASASRLENISSATGSESESEMPDQEEAPTEGSPLLKKTTRDSSKKDTQSSAENAKINPADGFGHESHSHNQPKEGGHGSHGDLNMRGIFLHVMGDALGNLGVIGSALIIWLTDYWWRFYSDPAISLIITLIILGSAVPLCKAASRILLQAVPTDINVDNIKADIKKLKGIENCHHLHVWQLSDTKHVATLHIKVHCDLGSAKYMDLAREVGQCLHAHGIHSFTIQPEFLGSSRQQSRSTSGNKDPDTDGTDSRRGRMSTTSGNRSREETIDREAEGCLLECGDECDEQGQCCAPGSTEADDHVEEGSSH